MLRHFLYSNFLWVFCDTRSVFSVFANLASRCSLFLDFSTVFSSQVSSTRRYAYAFELDVSFQ